MGAEQSIEMSNNSSQNSVSSNGSRSPRPTMDGVPTLYYGGHEACIRRHKEQRRRYRNMMMYGGSKAATMD